MAAPFWVAQVCPARGKQHIHQPVYKRLFVVTVWQRGWHAGSCQTCPSLVSVWYQASCSTCLSFPYKMGCCEPYELMPDVWHFVNVREMLIHYDYVFSHASHHGVCNSLVLPSGILYSLFMHKANRQGNKRAEMMRSRAGEVAKKTRPSVLRHCWARLRALLESHLSMCVKSL